MTAETLAKLLEAAGMSPTELAGEMKCSRAIVAFYLNGQRRISATFAAKALPLLKQRAMRHIRESADTLHALEEAAAGA